MTKLYPNQPSEIAGGRQGRDSIDRGFSWSLSSPGEAQVNLHDHWSNKSLLIWTWLKLRPWYATYAQVELVYLWRSQDSTSWTCGLVWTVNDWDERNVMLLQLIHMLCNFRCRVCSWPRTFISSCSFCTNGAYYYDSQSVAIVISTTRPPRIYFRNGLHHVQRMRRALPSSGNNYSFSLKSFHKYVGLDILQSDKL